MVHDPDGKRGEHEKRGAPADHESRDQAAGWMQPDDREDVPDSRTHPVNRERERELSRGQGRTASATGFLAQPAQRGLALRRRKAGQEVDCGTADGVLRPSVHPRRNVFVSNADHDSVHSRVSMPTSSFTAVKHAPPSRRLPI
jgi:hypothetical protein